MLTFWPTAPTLSDAKYVVWCNTTRITPESYQDPSDTFSIKAERTSWNFSIDLLNESVSRVKKDSWCFPLTVWSDYWPLDSPSHVSVSKRCLFLAAAVDRLVFSKPLDRLKVATRLFLFQTKGAAVVLSGRGKGAILTTSVILCGRVWLWYKESICRLTAESVRPSLLSLTPNTPWNLTQH